MTVTTKSTMPLMGVVSADSTVTTTNDCWSRQPVAPASASAKSATTPATSARAPGAWFDPQFLPSLSGVTTAAMSERPHIAEVGVRRRRALRRETVGDHARGQADHGHHCPEPGLLVDRRPLVRRG